MYELVISLTSDDSIAIDRFSDALLESGALSVAIEAADSQQQDADLFEDPVIENQIDAGIFNAGYQKSYWENTIIRVIHQQDSARQLIEKAAKNAGLAHLPSYQNQALAERDWVKESEARTLPLMIGNRIQIIASWHSSEVISKTPSTLTVRLDPGLAFGTGNHATTQLCLEYIEQAVLSGQKVLDYGCGSGILAILAKKCGAAQVVGVDIDVHALQVARENSLNNQVDIVYRSCEQDQQFPEQYYLVVANILAQPLQQLAPLLAARVQPQGYLVLSGVLAKQAKALICAYQPWIALSLWKQRDEWVCLMGQKKRNILKTRMYN